MKEGIIGILGGMGPVATWVFSERSSRIRGRREKGKRYRL